MKGMKSKAGDKYLSEFFQGSVAVKDPQEPRGTPLPGASCTTMKLTSIATGYTSFKICGIATDDQGNIYYTAASSILWSGNHVLISGPHASTFHGIAYDTTNNILYLCDWLCHKIWKYSIQTCTLEPFAGDNVGHTDGKLKDAQFTYPERITLDKYGDLFITENHRIRKINVKQKTVETIAGSTGGFCKGGYKDGDALSAEFSFPSGIAVGNDGTIYVCDFGNNCIRVVKNGLVSTLVGKQAIEESWTQDGSLNEATVLSPFSIYLRSETTLIVSGNERPVFRIIDLKNDAVTSVIIKRKGFIRMMHMDNEGTIYLAEDKELFKVESFWKVKRLLWIGQLKEEASYCLFAKLPKDIIKEISNLCA